MRKLVKHIERVLNVEAPKVQHLVFYGSESPTTAAFPHFQGMGHTKLLRKL